MPVRHLFLSLGLGLVCWALIFGVVWGVRADEITDTEIDINAIGTSTITYDCACEVKEDGYRRCYEVQDLSCEDYWKFIDKRRGGIWYPDIIFCWILDPCFPR